MTTLISNLERDGERRPFADHGHAILGSAGGLTVLRGVFEPGWRWTSDVAPIAGTASCQTRHLGYIESGRMQVRLDDGTELTMAAGDLFDLPPGHDAWVLGDEPCVMYDYSPEVTRYARGRAEGIGAAEDAHMELVRRGYAAFNTADVDTLRSILSHDVVQHVPGSSQVAGLYKGIDAVLGYYAKLGELTGGTFRAHLIEVFGDGGPHVTALHQITATRDGMTRVSRGTIVFTFLGDRATDLLEMRSDLPGDDAFFA
ncbi:MAG TPA: nuclear transport factor 2 family protein [Jatrophihabitans sp.]|nr:nuclear transport factor 2 family protein [Jatrophihabitans sp.]